MITIWLQIFLRAQLSGENICETKKQIKIDILQKNKRKQDSLSAVGLCE